jgi:hypothetical protein
MAPPPTPLGELLCTLFQRDPRWLALADTPGLVGAGARSHCRFAPPLVLFIPDSLPYLVPRFLNRQCDRIPGRGHGPRAGRLLPPGEPEGLARLAEDVEVILAPPCIFH